MAGAYFFGMRPGEYSHVPDRGQMKLLSLDDLCFLDKNKQQIPLEKVSPTSQAEIITVTFRNQKNGVKQDARTHRKSVDPLLCPVRHWAYIVHYVLGHSQKGSIGEFLHTTK
jgi:hypothetical protein